MSFRSDTYGGRSTLSASRTHVIRAQTAKPRTSQSRWGFEDLDDIGGLLDRRARGRVSADSNRI
jgi:hypothetical protein